MRDEGDRRWAAQFPQLFAPAYVVYAGAHVQMSTGPVAEASINRTHVVAVTGEGRIVVCGSDLGWRFLPGGTREPGENLDELIARELLEEAGAELTGPAQVFSALAACSTRAEPYRPHLRHPDAFWAYAVAPVRLVGAPTCPDDGEQVTEVHCLPPDEAAAYLAQHDVGHADVVRLAAAMGLIG